MTAARIVTGYVIRMPTQFHAYDMDTTSEDCNSNDVSPAETPVDWTTAEDSLRGCYENRLSLEDTEEKPHSSILEVDDSRSRNNSKSNDSTNLALAVGADGVWLMRAASGELCDRLALMDTAADCRVFCAKFLRIAGRRKLAVLTMIQSSRRWFLRVYGTIAGGGSDGFGIKIDVDDVQHVECPIGSGAASAVAPVTMAVDVPRHDAGWWLRIATQRGVIFLLGCTRSCSAIWALALPNVKWRTILVEKTGGAALRSPLLMRMRPPEAPRPTIIGVNAQFPISSAATAAAADAEREASTRMLFKSRRYASPEPTAVALRDANDSDHPSRPPDAFTGFDVGEWRIASDFRRTVFSAETRVLLCEAAKSRLNILRLSSSGRIESRVVKTKRSKELGWIVRGPQLAIWDEKKDVIVFDASGKLFCFGGADYRIKRVLSDFGRHEVTALAARAGWCFAADATGRCIHALRYRNDNDSTENFGTENYGEP